MALATDTYDYMVITYESQSVVGDSGEIIYYEYLLLLFIPIEEGLLV